MAPPKLRIGTNVPAAAGIDAFLEGVRLREALGFYSLNWADHLMSMYPQSIWTPDILPAAQKQHSPHIYFDAVAAIAAAATVSSQLRLSVGVTDPFRRHPAMLAQEFLSLDHVSRGRVILGIGTGERLNTEPYGLMQEKPVGRLEEALKIIRLLWSTDQPVDYDGQFWRMKGAVLGLRPFGQNPPPIWLGAMGPRMLQLCGQYCDGWFPLKMPPEEYGRKLATIKGIAADSGRDASAFTPSLVAFTIIGETHEECHRLLETPAMKTFALVAEPEIWEHHGLPHPLGDGFRPLQDYIPTRLTRQQVLDAMDRMPFPVVHDYLFHGTPEELCAEFERYVAQGMQHVQIFNSTPIADPSRMASSFEGLTQIVKHFK